MIALAFAMSLVGIGCEPGPATSQPSSVVDASTAAGGDDQLDCERNAYPCTWADVDPAATRRTDELLGLSSLLLAQEATADEIATRLRAADGVAEVLADKITVSFRVDGGMPVFVYVDPTEDGVLEGAIPPPGPDGDATAPQAAQFDGHFTGCWNVRDDRSDGQKGTVGKTGEPKKALLLGPWSWQMHWDTEALVDYLFLENPADYERPGGGVTTKVTLSDRPSALDTSEAAVRIEDFCGWEKYDLIMIKTHGRTVCERARCLTSLSVGRFLEDNDALREYTRDAYGVTFAASIYGNLKTTLTRAEALDCIERLEAPVPAPSTDPDADCLVRLPSAGHMLVTSDFFREYYRGTLKDRLIFISACQGMQGGDLARALRGGAGSTGAILGYDRIIQVDVADKVELKFVEDVGRGVAIDEAALRELNRIADDAAATADVAALIQGEFSNEELADVAPNGSETTRGSDIVSLHTERLGPELLDGGAVRFDGKMGDGKNDKLKLVARLIGVAEEGPDAYPVEIWADGRQLGLDGVSWQGDTEGAYWAEILADFGRDIVSTDVIDLEIRAVLPATGGAVSLWAYKGLRVGARATLSIGSSSWEFDVSDPFLGCNVSADGTEIVAFGYLFGSYDVQFMATLHPFGVGAMQRLDEANVASISVRDDVHDEHWAADATSNAALSAALGTIPGGSSQVDSLTIEGAHAWGTATFIDVGAVERAWSMHEPFPAAVSGTFDIQCQG